MNPNFQNAMAEATRLVHAGNLNAATALIQSALRADGTPRAAPPFTSARQRGEVIDIEARVVDDDAPASLLGRAFAPLFKTPAAPAATPAQPPAEPAAAGASPAQPGGEHPARGLRRPFARPGSKGLESLATLLGGHFEPLSVPASPHAPAVEPLRPGEGRFIDGSHTEAGSTRSFKLYIPPERHGKALPLVVMLHGCTQHPDDFAAGTGMNEAACAQGCYVLYPAQSQKMNPQRCWNWFKHSHQARGRGEAALLAGMTRAVIEEHGIDPQRVYVAGLSAGGAMAAILGTVYPDVFAAVGVHSGLPAGAATDLPSALAAMQAGAPAAAPTAPPTIVFHGDQDHIVHPINGEQAVAAGAGVTAAAAEVEQGQSAGGRAYTRRIWRHAGGQAVAEHWNVHGAGHAWSGGRRAGSYTDAQGPDATGAMLRFFLTHRLEQQPPAARPGKDAA